MKHKMITVGEMLDLLGENIAEKKEKEKDKNE